MSAEAALSWASIGAGARALDTGAPRLMLSAMPCSERAPTTRCQRRSCSLCCTPIKYPARSPAPHLGYMHLD